MDALLLQYLDPDLTDWLSGMLPFVGAGLILGFIFVILGWLFGFVWGLIRLNIQ